MDNKKRKKKDYLTDTMTLNYWEISIYIKIR